MPVFVSPDNIQWTPLQAQVFAAGASTSIQTAGSLPTGRRVRRVLFILDIDATQPAAPAAQFGFGYFQLLAQVKIGRRISVSGQALRILNWMMRGMEPMTPAGFPAGVAGNVFSRRVVWSLDFVDLSAQRPDDGAIPSELWTEPIEVRFGTNAIFAAPVLAFSSGLLRTYVEHDAAATSKNGKRATVPPSLNIQSDDFNALQATINKPGVWAYAAVFREVTPADDGIITSANVSNLLVSVDGIPLVSNARAQDQCAFFNQARAHGNNFEQEGNTDPVPGATAAAAPIHMAGSAIMDQPAVGAGAGQDVTMNFVPLLFPDNNYKLSQLPRAKIGLNVTMQGTLGPYRIVYRLVERRPDQGVGNAARRLGITNGTFKAKTGQSPLSDDPELAPFLPAIIQES